MKCRVSVAAVLCAAIMLVAPTARAGRFFVGGSIGQSSVETSVDDVDLDIDFSGDDTGYKLFGGVAFKKNFSIEVAAFDLGSVNDTILGFDLESEVYGVDAALTAGVSLFRVVNAYVKAGVAWWRVDATVTDGVSVLPYRNSGNDFFWGLGGRFDVGPIAIRAEFEVFELEQADEVSLVSVGIDYRF